jgi:hypothetical protein
MPYYNYKIIQKAAALQAAFFIFTITLSSWGAHERTCNENQTAKTPRRVGRAALYGRSRRTRPPRHQAWGDSAQYDFILEHHGRFIRIQVKSTQFKDSGAYPCAVHGSGQRAYPDAAFDFLAVYVVPEDAWYIIPAHAFRGQASVCLRPSQARSKYGKYLAAWDLMKGGPTASPDSTSPTEVTCV